MTGSALFQQEASGRLWSSGANEATLLEAMRVRKGSGKNTPPSEQSNSGRCAALYLINTRDSRWAAHMAARLQGPP